MQTKEVVEQEKIDIVDDQNRPTGEIVSRELAHSEALWHRTVHVYFYQIVRDEIRILTHKRSKRVERSAEKCDARFGGHVKAGQGYQEAALEEVTEETGLILKPEELVQGQIYKLNSKDKLHNQFAQVYFYKFSGSVNELTLNKFEIESVEWMNLDNVLQSAQAYPDKWTSNLQHMREVFKQLKTLHD